MSGTGSHHSAPPPSSWPSNVSHHHLHLKVRNREQLEDQVLQLEAEHLVLKKDAHDAGHQVKCLNAKLSRLICEKKRLVGKARTSREVELEEVIYDLIQKVGVLETDNVRLKERTLLLRTQLDSGHAKRSSSAYSYVRSRVDSGLPQVKYRASSATAKLGLGAKASSTLSLNRVTFAPGSGHLRGRRTAASATATSRQVSSPGRAANKSHINGLGSESRFPLDLLQEAREEIQSLEEVIAAQQSYLETYLQLESNPLKAFSKDSRRGCQLSLATRGQQEVTSTREQLDNKYSMSESEEETRRPQIADKPSKVGFECPEKSERTRRVNEDIAQYVDRLQLELAQEQAKNSLFQKQLVSERLSETKVDEVKQRIRELEKENDILRESLEKCIGSCLSEINGGKESKGKEGREGGERTHQLHYHQQLQLKVNQLESEKLSLINELTLEKQNCVKLRHECRELSNRLLTSQNSLEEARDQLQTKEPLKRGQTSGGYCNRRDHLELQQQLAQKQKETREFLREFTEMKQMLHLVQNSIVDDQQFQDQVECEREPAGHGHAHEDGSYPNE